MTVLNIAQLCFSIGGQPILQDISLQVDKGEFIGIIGPNGSGKSTLLKNIYKIYTPDSGNIRLHEKDVTHISNRKMAQLLAVVAQENNVNFDFTVNEVVSMGRYPQKGLLEVLSPADQAIVSEALCQVGMEAFAERSFLELSGGEKQRVLIARALAQQTETVILDEPTNHLDIGSQLSTLKLLKTSGKTIVAALHDLPTAANYCDRIYVLSKGAMLCAGSPGEVIQNSLIKELYGINADVFWRNQKLFVDYL